MMVTLVEWLTKGKAQAVDRDASFLRRLNLFDTIEIENVFEQSRWNTFLNMW